MGISHISSITPLMDGLREGVIEIDGRGNIVAANPAAAEILGMEQSALMGAEMNDDWNAVDRQGQPIEMTNFPVILARDTGAPQLRELLGLGPEKDRLWIEIDAYPMADDSAVAIFSDVTDRIISDRLLRYIAQVEGSLAPPDFLVGLTRTLAELLGVEYAFIDRLTTNPDEVETLALFANGEMVSNIRYSLKGTPCENVIGKTLCCYTKNVQQLFPDDHLLVELNAESYIGLPLWSTDGKPIGLIAVMGSGPLKRPELAKSLLQMAAARAAQALEAQKFEAVIEDSQQFYQAVLETLPVGVACADAETGILTTCNKALCDLVKRTSQSLIGQSQKILHPAEDHLDTGSKSFEEHRKLKGYKTISTRVITSDGEIRDVDIIAGPIEFEGRPLIVGIYIDQTGKLEMERRLRRVQKLEATGLLAGGIAHDFNNILGAIMGNAELIRLTNADAETEEYVSGILGASDRAKELIQRLMSFARQDAGNREPIDLTREVTDAVKLVESSSPKNISLGCEIAIDNATVYSSKIDIHQILLNLCTNAIQAIGEKPGSVRVRCGNCNLSPDEAARYGVSENSDYVMLSVIDDGPGIAKEHLDKIFDPFFTTKEIGKGTGLGLSVVHGIVKDLGGGIAIDSNVGSGTQVSIVLPVSTEEVFPSGEHSKKALHFPNTNVMILDDELALLETSSAMLRHLGCRVSAFQRPADALEALKTAAAMGGSFDLVISDFAMPQMNGLDWAREALKIVPDLKIYLVTGYMDTIETSAVKKIGCQDIVYKPIGLDHFAQMLDEVTQ